MLYSLFSQVDLLFAFMFVLVRYLSWGVFTQDRRSQLKSVTFSLEEPLTNYSHLQLPLFPGLAACLSCLALLPPRCQLPMHPLHPISPRVVFPNHCISPAGCCHFLIHTTCIPAVHCISNCHPLQYM